MLNQQKVNEICHMIKNNGEEITIAKVYGLIDKESSFFALIDKVILFKKNPKLAIQLALNEKEKKEINKHENIKDIIHSVFSNYDNDQDMKIILQEKIQKFIKNKFIKKIKRIQDQSKKIKLLNSHIEVRYYGLKSRYEILSIKLSSIKKSYHTLYQKLKNIKIINKKNKDKIDNHVNFRKEKHSSNTKYQKNVIHKYEKNYHAIYDPNSKQIFLKIPLKHILVKELKKGKASIYLCANATFNYIKKVWVINDFEYRTIDLLVRNKIIISKELYMIFKHLQSKKKQKILQNINKKVMIKSNTLIFKNSIYTEA